MARCTHEREGCVGHVADLISLVYRENLFRLNHGESNPGRPVRNLATILTVFLVPLGISNKSENFDIFKMTRSSCARVIRNAAYVEFFRRNLWRASSTWFPLFKLQSGQ
jgi:hypothetical protein